MNNGHILLEHMDVRQFKLHPAVQDVLQVMQNKLLEDGYAAFGRVDWSPAGERFNSKADALKAFDAWNLNKDDGISFDEYVGMIGPLAKLRHDLNAEKVQT